jgi:hypothetical protein
MHAGGAARQRGVVERFRNLRRGRRGRGGARTFSWDICSWGRCCSQWGASDTLYVSMLTRSGLQVQVLRVVVAGQGNQLRGDTAWAVSAQHQPEHAC